MHVYCHTAPTCRRAPTRHPPPVHPTTDTRGGGSVGPPPYSAHIVPYATCASTPPRRVPAADLYSTQSPTGYPPLHYPSPLQPSDTILPSSSIPPLGPLSPTRRLRLPLTGVNPPPPERLLRLPLATADPLPQTRGPSLTLRVVPLYPSPPLPTRRPPQPPPTDHFYPCSPPTPMSVTSCPPKPLRAVNPPPPSSPLRLHHPPPPPRTPSPPVPASAAATPPTQHDETMTAAPACTAAATTRTTRWCRHTRGRRALCRERGLPSRRACCAAPRRRR